ncbi:hypothetical protein [Streptomyces sp. NPDC057302]|uniref:hypothetical protein n=1 Tax=Streptomyces sp. NPDC057302 TaxID=3346094 RepID=UPI0036259EB1
MRAEEDGEWWHVVLEDGPELLTFWRGYAPVSCWFNGWLVPVRYRDRVFDLDLYRSARREVVPDFSAVTADRAAACSVPIHHYRRPDATTPAL